MKRIDAIIKDKCSKLTNLFTRKSARIMRNVDSAIACAEDEIDAAKEHKEKVINSLATVADADKTAECSRVLNNYIEVAKQQKAWEETLAILKDLKKELNSEVTLEETEE